MVFKVPTLSFNCMEHLSAMVVPIAGCMLLLCHWCIVCYLPICWPLLLGGCASLIIALSSLFIAFTSGILHFSTAFYGSVAEAHDISFVHMLASLGSGVVKVHKNADVLILYIIYTMAHHTIGCWVLSSRLFSDGVAWILQDLVGPCAASCSCAIM
jgi:hypothetical protein